MVLYQYCISAFQQHKRTLYSWVVIIYSYIAPSPSDIVLLFTVSALIYLLSGYGFGSLCLDV